jgi:hypothetical protein
VAAGLGASPTHNRSAVINHTRIAIGHWMGNWLGGRKKRTADEGGGEGAGDDRAGSAAGRGDGGALHEHCVGCVGDVRVWEG